MNFNTPKQMTDKFNWIDDRKLSTSVARLQTTSNYFRWRSVDYWNKMTSSLRQPKKISIFKTELRNWVINRRTEVKPFDLFLSLIRPKSVY